MTLYFKCLLLAGLFFTAGACSESNFAGNLGSKSKTDGKDDGEDDAGDSDGGEDAGDADGADGTDSDGGVDAVDGEDADGDIDGDDSASDGDIDADSDNDDIKDSCDGDHGLINFEKLPNGVASQDGMEIHDQFKESHGVTFKMKNGSNPRLAKVGSPMTAYQCGGCTENDDGVGAGFEAKLGSFFLTDDGVVGGAPPPLVITYEEPVKKASGNLLDVDGTEVWDITALDKDGTELGKVTLNSATGKNGGPSLWSFTEDDATIASIVLTGSGKTSGFGLAFDSFSPTAVCD